MEFDLTLIVGCDLLSGGAVVVERLVMPSCLDPYRLPVLSTIETDQQVVLAFEHEKITVGMPSTCWTDS